MTLKEQILEYLRENPGSPDAILGRALETSHQAVNQACRELEQQGKLSRRKKMWRGRELIGNYLVEKEYVVQLEWDEDKNIWTANSEDIPGLALWWGSLDALIERVRQAAPEQMALWRLPKGILVFRVGERRERLYGD